MPHLRTVNIFLLGDKECFDWYRLIPRKNLSLCRIIKNKAIWQELKTVILIYYCLLEMAGVERIFHLFGNTQQKDYKDFVLPKIDFQPQCFIAEPTVQMYSGQQTYESLKRDSIISKSTCEKYLSLLEDEKKKRKKWEWKLCGVACLICLYTGRTEPNQKNT